MPSPRVAAAFLFASLPKIDDIERSRTPVGDDEEDEDDPSKLCQRKSKKVEELLPVSSFVRAEEKDICLTPA